MIGAVVPVHGSSSSGGATLSQREGELGGHVRNELLTGAADVAIVRVSKDDVCSEKLLQLLEELKAKGRIIEWGITRTSYAGNGACVVLF